MTLVLLVLLYKNNFSRKLINKRSEEAFAKSYF